MLTPRKKHFADLYLSTRNATESAKQAGYSTKTAYSIGSRLLKDVEVKAIIDAGLQQEHAELTEKTFVKLAMKDYEAVEQDSANRPRFLHLAGQAVGIIKNGSSDSRPNQTLNITVNKLEVNALPTGKKWDELRNILESD
jgi:hypothetical protein